MGTGTHSPCFLNGPGGGGEECSLPLHRWENQGDLASILQFLDNNDNAGTCHRLPATEVIFLLNKLMKCQSLGLEPEAQSGLGSLWAGHKACPSLSLGYHLAVPLPPRSGDVCSPKPWSWAEGGTQGISVQKS